MMHLKGFTRRSGERIVEVPAGEAFSGRDLTRFAYSIRGLVRATEAQSILDYGSGKGKQYSEELKRGGKVIAGSVHEFWGVREITCYDPAINKSFLSPRRIFDGVLATNIMDHIPEEDVEWVVKRLFSRASKFVFCNVADFPSPLSLPNGENARVTRKPKYWWNQIFTAANARYPDVSHCLAFAERKKTEEGLPKQSISYLHNCPGLILPGPRIKVSGTLKISR
ncbi:MAG: hypothetical protein ABJO11_09500 [Sneathiella sp.]